MTTLLQFGRDALVQINRLKMATQITLSDLVLDCSAPIPVIGNHFVGRDMLEWERCDAHSLDRPLLIER
jgi:hypothetical protein